MVVPPLVVGSWKMFIKPRSLKNEFIVGSLDRVLKSPIIIEFLCNFWNTKGIEDNRKVLRLVAICLCKHTTLNDSS